MQNGIDPKVSIWLNVGISALGVITSSTAALTTIFGTSTAQIVVAVAGLVVGILGGINVGLHAASSNVAGPLVANK